MRTSIELILELDERPHVIAEILTAAARLHAADIEPRRAAEMVRSAPVLGMQGVVHAARCDALSSAYVEVPLHRVMSLMRVGGGCQCLGAELAALLEEMGTYSSSYPRRFVEEAVRLLRNPYPALCEGAPSVISTVDASVLIHEPLLGGDGALGGVLRAVLQERLLATAQLGVEGFSKRHELEARGEASKVVSVNLDQDIDHSGRKSAAARIALARGLVAAFETEETIASGRFIALQVDELAARGVYGSERAGRRGVNLPVHAPIALALRSEEPGLSLAASLRLARHATA